MENKKVCKFCGSVENVVETYDGSFVCEDCLDTEHYFYCEECGDWHPLWRRQHVYFNRFEADCVCTDCAELSDEIYYCEDCRNWYYTSYRDMVTVEREFDTIDLCSDCYEYNYVTCVECGAEIHRDAAYDDDDEWICHECAEKRRVIKNYSYKPDPRCKRKDKGSIIEFNIPADCKEMLFGVELEIDDGTDRNDCARELCETHSDIYIKRDGSLSDCDGMEIVTHPCTLEYHMEELGWDTICDIARKYDYRSHDTRCCGLHVHVGKAQLGETSDEVRETIAKIIMLVDRHWDALRVFSRRRRGQLNEWASPPELNLKQLKTTLNSAVEIALAYRTGSRYRAINITNRNTIEFRLFNGSLKPTTIMATLQLVSNICEYAKKYAVRTCVNSQWDDIVNFKYYPELTAYCKSRGLTEVDELDYIFFPKEPELEEGTPNVGDRVFVKSFETIPANFLGQSGVIKYMTRDVWSEVAYVEFDRKFCDALQNMGVHITSGCGYPVHITDLAKIR